MKINNMVILFASLIGAAVGTALIAANTALLPRVGGFYLTSVGVFVGVYLVHKANNYDAFMRVFMENDELRKVFVTAARKSDKLPKKDGE
jgi:hypothetical protein